MNTIRHDRPWVPSAASLQNRPLAIALVMIALIGGFYLLREHWGHVAGLWPYLLLLACPVNKETTDIHTTATKATPTTIKPCHRPPVG